MDIIEDTKLCSIYRCTNIVNGKVYIGFTTDLHRRKTVHLSSSKKEDTKFYRAIRKYGEQSFIWEIIYQSYDFDHCLKVMEPYFIIEYDSYKSGYNSTHGGDGARGLVLSEDAKRKISDGNKVPKPGAGKYERTEEHLKILSEIRAKIPPRSKETREKMSKAAKGKPKSKAHIESMKTRWQDTLEVECPYCQKVGGYKEMMQWHFERCKMNPDRVEHRPLLVCEHCGYSALRSANFYRNHGNNCKMKSLQ